MRNFLLLLLLAAIVYFGYRRAVDYGLPWEDQIVISSYEQSKRFRAGGEQVYVHGMVRNQTRKAAQATIECKTLPEGMTITPKNTTTVAMNPEETVPFEMDLRSNLQVTGARCRVFEWSTSGGAEIQAWNWIKRQWSRLTGVVR